VETVSHQTSFVLLTGYDKSRPALCTQALKSQPAIIACGIEKQKRRPLYASAHDNVPPLSHVATLSVLRHVVSVTKLCSTAPNRRSGFLCISW